MITIRYFGQLRDLAGLSDEHIECAGRTPAQLYTELRSKYRFPLEQRFVRVAVNDEFADWEAVLADGDLVVFIPPVAGG